MLAEALVWTVVVEVTLVLAKDAASVTLVVGQHPVSALSADAPDEPVGLGSSVRPCELRTSSRCYIARFER